MAEKIKASDIFSGDLTGKAIKEFEALIKVLERLEEQQKEVLKNSAEGIKVNTKEYEQVKKNTKAVNDFEQAEKELTATEKERIKLQKKLAQLNEEEYKQNVILKNQIQAKNKELKEEAKETLGQVKAYEKKAKLLNELRKQYKNLIVQEGKATKETRELKKEIQALDTELKDVDADVGQFQRNVGDYANAIKDAGSDISGAFTGGLIGGAIGGALSKAGDFFSSSKEAGSNAKKALIPILAGLQVAFSSLVDIIPVLAKDLKVLFLEMKKGFTELTNPFTDVTDQIAEFDKEINELESNFKGKGYGDAFSNFGDRVDKVTEQMLENLEVNRKAELQILRLSRSVSKLTAEEEKLRTEADDNNRSFDERAKKFEQARILADKRTKAEVALAKAQLKVQEGLVLEQLKQAGVSENLTNLLSDQARANKVNEETLGAYVEALNAVTDAEGQRNQQIAQDSKEANDIARDLFEQNLDYALDYTDNQKAINERLINDETLTLETRKNLLAETNAIFEKALSDQVALFEGQTGTTIDINTLLNAEDSGTLLETVRALGMGEIETQRLLEVIRDYKTGVQDLNEAQQDLNLSSEEAVQLNSEIALQYQYLNGEIKTTEDLEKGLTEATIENLKTRLSTLKEGSVEYLRVLKEINDLEIELMENTEDADKKLLEQRKELREATEQVLTEVVNKYTEERITAIDKEIQANEKRQTMLQELAGKGIQDAKENLAEEKKQQAELERERERALKRQQQIELGLAVLNSYSNNLENDVDNPLAKTITDTQVLLQFVRSLPTFYYGTEDTGQGGKIDNKGGFHAILHPNERVMTAEENAPLKGISNIELSNLGKAYKKGVLSPVISVDNTEVVNKLDEIAKKPTYLGRDYDATEKAIIETIARKGRIERNHKKTGKNLF